LSYILRHFKLKGSECSENNGTLFNSITTLLQTFCSLPFSAFCKHLYTIRRLNWYDGFKVTLDLMSLCKEGYCGRYSTLNCTYSQPIFLPINRSTYFQRNLDGRFDLLQN
jgi:hypothetical protein